MDSLTRLRRAEDPAALLAAVRSAGVEASLAREIDDFIDWTALTGRVESALSASLDEAGLATLGDTLGDAVFWERFRKRAGSSGVVQVLYQLRGSLAELAAEARPVAPAPAPKVVAPAPKVVALAPKVVLPPPEDPPLFPGMPLAQLRAWAGRHGVTTLLTLPVEQVPASTYLVGTSHFFFYRRGSTVEETLSTEPARNQKALLRGVPPIELGRHLVRWLEAQGVRATRALADEAAELAARREPADPHLRVAWSRLVAAREAVRREAAPLPREPGSLTIELGEDPPEFECVGRSNETCGTAWHGTRVTVRLQGDSPVATCACSRPGAGRCGTVLAALDASIAWLEGRHPGSVPSRAATVLAVPAWARTLGDIDCFTGSETEEEPPVIGWGIEVAGDAVALWPLACRPKKRGDGWKVGKASQAELDAASGPTAALDHLVADTLPERGYGVDARVRTTHAIERLAGHPRLFWGGKSTAQMQVRTSTLGFRLSPTGDGGVRLLVSAGGDTVEPADWGGYGVHVKDRVLRWDEARAVLTVVRAGDGARALAGTLARRGASFPAEALPEVVRRLPSLARVAPIQAGDLVQHVVADPQLLVRLEVLSGDLVRVEARVRVLPGVPPLVPGEPPEEVFSHAADAIVAARRDAAAEVALVHGRLGAIPLGPTLPDEPFTWQVDEPERALDVLAALQETSGVEVEWCGQRRRVASATANALRVSVGSARDWFAVGGELQIDGAKLSIARLLEALAERRAFVKLDDHTWLRLERRFRDRLEALADATDGGALAPVNAPVLLALEELGSAVTAPKRWTEHLAAVRSAASFDPPLPPELRAELRPYQHEGFRWLARLATWAEGAVLADDMGLGKTVQALALLLRRAALGPALVVAPTSVGFNWVRQAALFAPTLRVRLARGADRPRTDDAPQAGDVWVTSYDLLVRDVETLAGFSFATFVLDEAQAIKNPDTQRAKAARAIRAEFRVALSGTPLENRTGELWSLFAAVAPGVLGTWTRFRATYALPIERDGDVGKRQSLARRIRPFVLRRLKSEVARDLPPRTEVRVDVDLSDDERSLYDAARGLALRDLTSSGTPDHQRRFQVLAALTRLRQLACHPRLVDPEFHGASAKLDRLVELLRELREEGRRTLVFSQFVRQLELVRETLLGEGFRLRWLDGSTPELERRAEVEAFQRGEGDVFLVSLKAGGTGIDLTAASDVVLLDPWWNPAVEDQAADRAHRIGQTRAVTVYRLVARETVEDRILALHEQKRDLASAVLEGTGAGAAMTTDELLELLREGG